jgi:hypothetical protein
MPVTVTLQPARAAHAAPWIWGEARERRPLCISVLGRGDKRVSSQSCAFEFGPHERRTLLFVLGRGDRRVSSRSAFSFSCSFVTGRSCGSAATVCAAGFVPISRRRRVGIVGIAPRHPPPRGYPRAPARVGRAAASNGRAVYQERVSATRYIAEREMDLLFGLDNRLVARHIVR